MGSATWVCISWAVAPGQIAETFTTLTVKNGSSARPSRWYEKKPAAPSAIIRNRIRVGWLTAQPERLKRFMSPSNIYPLLPATHQNDSDETTRTFSAGSSFCTPSATTLAPSLTPPVMTTELLS